MFKGLAPAAVALALALPVTAARADVVVLTFTGEVAFGVDQTGVFGPGGDIAGQQAMLILRYDTALAPPGVAGVFTSDFADWFEVSLSIGAGDVLSFADDGALMRLASLELIEDGANDQLNLIYQAVGPGPMSGGLYLDIAQSFSLNVTGDLFAGAETLPRFAGPVAATGSAAFSIDDLLCDTASCAAANRADGGLTFTAASAVLERGAPIPEPATWALMLLGFGGLGAALRARRQTSAA